MKKSEQRKKLYYTLLEFSSVEACFQEEAYLTQPKLITGEQIDKSINLQSKNFFIWGFTDILRLFVFDHLKGFAELQKLKPSCNTDDLKYCSGFCYTNEQLNLKEIMKRYPLLGISFLKFKDELFKYTEIEKYTNFIFEFLKNRVEETIKDEKGNYYIFPIISYGWEDVILLFFSKSYDLIKRSILELRTIKAEDIKDDFLKNKSKKFEFTHIFTTTFTIFGTYFPKYSLGTMKRSAAKVQRVIDKSDKAHVCRVKFQVRPGHIKKLELDLKKRFPNMDVKPAPYRADLCLCFKGPVNLHKFLYFYPHIIAIIRDKNTPVISLETEFEMDKSLLAGFESVRVSKEIKKRDIKIDRTIIRWLKKEEILSEEHSLLGFINLLSDVSFFQNHYFIKQSMAPWINTVETLKNYLLNLKRIWPRQTDEQLLFFKKILSKFIETFLIYLPSTFTDRFRGIYPVGETSIIPLLTYKTSLQKFLTCIDYICIKIFKDVLFLFNEDYEYPKDFSFCSTFTTEFSPAVRSFLWLSSFIFIPDIFIYKLKLTYIPHEIGHAFFDYFEKESLQRLNQITSDFDSSFYNIEKRNIIPEILSDYFALCVGHKGDLGDFNKHFYKFKSSEVPIRRKAIEWLYANVTNSVPASQPFLETEIKSSNRNAARILNHALVSILTRETSLKNRLLKLKNSASSFQYFPYRKLFEKENWIEFFLKFSSEIEI